MRRENHIGVIILSALNGRRYLKNRRLAEHNGIFMYTGDGFAMPSIVWHEVLVREKLIINLPPRVRDPCEVVFLQQLVVRRIPNPMLSP